ncbi:MAG: ABC transporter permease [Azospirillaceae bacterium]|nr:ABC transporter permease [Azospirillaceae bacterium]
MSGAPARAALVAAAALAGELLTLVASEFQAGLAPTLLLGIAALTIAALAMSRLSRHDHGAARLAVPALFGLTMLWLWQVITTTFGIPKILLPAPSEIAVAFIANSATLGADFMQTFVRSVIPGYVMGCGAGFLLAIAIDRSNFLQRGLLPFGNLAAAVPVVGIAPIMVMWFGFDWESKAAVIVVMTVFPMLINTTAGLSATSAMELDLMRSYAARYGQTLVKLRLPAAMPYIFNALKLNSTLALIGGIVAEFFGTPIVGMGFRISTEVARMNIDIVWATIAVAALSGSLSYGVLSIVERATTFWHPSFRK